MIRYLLVSIAALVLALVARSAEPAKKPNVLFIAVDDLNHWVGHSRTRPTSPHQTLAPRC